MNVTLDTDTRQVRRDTEGFYRSGAGKRICDHCGHRALCPMSDWATRCRQFLPALPFTDETGLGKIANTMRVGRAWTQRLELPQTVALYNSKARVIFGYSDAVSMDDGHIVSMLKRHASANHLMLDTPNHKAAAVLGAWMRQQYGPQIIHDRTTLTAIYLLRVSEPPPAPSLEGLEADGVGEGRPADPGQADRE